MSTPDIGPPAADVAMRTTWHGLRWTRRTAVIAMLLSVVIYGSNFVITRHATLNGLTANDLVALRFAVAGPMMLALFLRAPLSTCGGVGWFRGIVITIVSGAPMALLMNTGLAFAPASHGASITPGTVTLISAVGSALIFGIYPRVLGAFGLVAAFAGLACLARGATSGGSDATLTGDAFFFAAGLVWGSYPLLVRLWALDGLQATAVIGVVSTAYLPIYAFGFDGSILNAPIWFVVVHAINQGVFNVIIGLWLWTNAARVLGPAVAGRFPPMIPVIGTLLAVPTLGEWPGYWQSLGIALIAGGLLVAAVAGTVQRTSWQRR